jgi:transcriptional regulator with XRE-family HTH domain
MAAVARALRGVWARSHTHADMLSPAQLRAARALLGWTRDDLAAKSGVAAVTVKGFEYLGAYSKKSTVQKMQRALEAAGNQFIDEDSSGGVGVRLAAGVRLRGAGPKR